MEDLIRLLQAPEVQSVLRQTLNPSQAHEGNASGPLSFSSPNRNNAHVPSPFASRYQNNASAPLPLSSPSGNHFVSNSGCVGNVPRFTNSTIPTCRENFFRNPVASPSHVFNPSVFQKRKSINLQYFEKEVVYYNAAYHERGTVLKSSEKSLFIKKKHLINNVKFFRQMNAEQVTMKIAESFDIASFSSVQIFIPCGKHLSELNLETGCTLDGERLYKLFAKKTIYVKSDMNAASTSSLQISNSDSDDSDVFLPKKQKTDNDISCFFNEVTQTYSIIDEFGDKHELKDVQSSEKSNLLECPSPTLIPLCFKEVLVALRKKQGAILSLKLRRDMLADDFVEATKKTEFSVFSRLRVTFKGEIGHDLGGLTQEFLRLFLLSLKEDPYLFEGEENSKTLVLSLANLKCERYKMLGKFIQLSLLNNGPSPNFFSPLLYHLLINDSPDDFQLDLSCVKNKHVFEELKNLEACENAFQFNDQLASSSAYVSYCGTLHCVSSSAFDITKKIVIDDVIREYAVERIQRPLLQLKEGLNIESNFLSFMKKNPENFKELFCFSEEMALTAAKIDQTFHAVCNKECEQEALRHWRKFLSQAEAGDSSVTLKQILVFAFARDSLPVLGFTSKPVITFNDGILPRARTCFNELILPLSCEDFDQFKVMFEVAVETSEAFLSV